MARASPGVAMGLPRVAGGLPRVAGVLPRRRGGKGSAAGQGTAGRRGGQGGVWRAGRRPGGVWGGWGAWPGGRQERGDNLVDCLRREIQEELEINSDVEEEVASVEHEYTHLSITLHAFAARYRSGRARAVGCSAFEWIDVDRLENFAIPRADHRVLEALAASGTSLHDLINRE